MLFGIVLIFLFSIYRNDVMIFSFIFAEERHLLNETEQLGRSVCSLSSKLKISLQHAHAHTLSRDSLWCALLCHNVFVKYAHAQRLYHEFIWIFDAWIDGFVWCFWGRWHLNHMINKAIMLKRRKRKSLLDACRALFTEFCVIMCMAWQK